MIPFYYYLRLGFFVYLMAPQTKGALVIYNSILKPILDQNKEKINGFINDVKGSAAEISAEAKKAATEEPVDNRQ